MEDLGVASRIAPVFDSSMTEAYSCLVTKDTSVETNGSGRSDVPGAMSHRNGPHNGSKARPASEGVETPEPEPHGLSVYSRKRFMAVVAGALPAADYSREVAQHVDGQLARRRATSQR
jgi:hypothetical protein